MALSYHPKVSVLLPFYQVENFIERSARSVLEQSYDNLEFIFINDHSTDNGPAILLQTLEDYPKRKAQASIVTNEERLGISSTRNRAVSLATGDFIFWIDADDYITPDAILHLVERQQETGADLVTGKAVVIEADRTFETPMSCGTSIPETISAILKSTVFPMLWGRLIRTDLYKAHSVQTMDGVNYREDYQVLPQLVYYSDTIAELDEVIYYYDQSNAASYNSRAKRDIRIRLTKDLQDLASTEIVRDFFKDREPGLAQQNEENIAVVLLTTLRDATRANDKRVFLETARKYAEMDEQYVHPSGKNLWKMLRISPVLSWWAKRFHSLLLEPQLHR